MNNLCFFTIVADDKHPKELEESIKKFHPEASFVTIGRKEIDASGDARFLERAVPSIMAMLLKEYEKVIYIASNQIIKASFNPYIEGNYDAVVFKRNTAEEAKNDVYSVWFIPPFDYFMIGVVIMSNQRLAAHWLKMCYQPYFDKYERRQEDMMNILFHYGDSNVRFFIKEELTKLLK